MIYYELSSKLDMVTQRDEKGPKSWLKNQRPTCSDSEEPHKNNKVLDIIGTQRAH